MKRIFTILSFCLPLFAFGQSLEFSPSNSISEEHEINDWGGEQIHIKNVSGTAMPLNLKVISNSFPNSWATSFCTNLHCYNYIPSSSNFGTIQDGEEGYFLLNVGFYEAGLGEVAFEIYNPNDDSVKDTVYFSYNVIDPSTTGTTNLDNDYQFKISPNPTSGILNMTNGQLDNYEVFVYSLTGQLVLSKRVSGKTWNGDLSNQSPGFYFVTVVNEEGLIFREKISKF